MTKYATFATDGFPTAFYSEDIHGARLIDGEPNPDCSIPPGAVEISDADWRDFVANPARRRWVDGAVVAYDPPPPATTTDDVEAERDRRLALGFDYDFGDERGVHHIGTKVSDMKGWDEVTKIANALINVGDTETTVHIETNTGGADVTAQEWNAILLYAGQVRQPVWQASFDIAKMDPLPDDVTDDALWPAAS